MASYRSAWPGMPIEIERVAEGEPGDIGQGLTAQHSGWPVDHTGDGTARHEYVAGPEVAMHNRARGASRPNPSADGHDLLANPPPHPPTPPSPLSLPHLSLN